MTEWNYDLSTAPRGGWETREVSGRGGTREVEVYVAPRVILALESGMVLTSRWVPPNPSRNRPGRWEFIGRKEQPVAWQLYPSHPAESADTSE